MIKSWTDTDGTTHYADEHSKAYRKREEREPESSGTIKSTLIRVEQDPPAEPAKRPRRNGEDSPS